MGIVSSSGTGSGHLSQFYSNRKAKELSPPRTISLGGNHQTKLPSAKRTSKEYISNKIHSLHDGSGGGGSFSLAADLIDKNKEKQPVEPPHQAVSAVSSSGEYKSTNKLVFKGSAFSLKIAGISNRSSSRRIDIQSNLASKILELDNDEFDSSRSLSSPS